MSTSIAEQFRAHFTRLYVAGILILTLPCVVLGLFYHGAFLAFAAWATLCTVSNMRFDLDQYHVLKRLEDRGWTRGEIIALPPGVIARLAKSGFGR